MVQASKRIILRVILFLTFILRNGVPIQTHGGDSNFIMSSTGHLLILQARLEDTANYTCVAANIARQRTSPKALVTVYSEFLGNTLESL